jgi:hypothetical protein
MDTQQIDHTIRRARRNTIGDAVGRSAARNPKKDAIIFGERRWSHAEDDLPRNAASKILERELREEFAGRRYGQS